MSLFAIFTKIYYKKVICFQLSHFKAEELILRGFEKKSIADIVKGNIGKQLINIIMKYHDKLFAISEQMKSSLISWYNIPPHRIIALPEGVDTFSHKDKIQDNRHQIRTEIRYKYNITDNDIVLIYAGTLNKFRKLDILINIISEINREFNMYLFVVGGSLDKDDLEILKMEAQSLNVSEKCFFTGFISQELVLDYLLAADIGISPFPANKVLINNSPIKILEYWNAGLPVVASDIPEQRLLMNACGGGILVEHTLDAYISAIKSLIADKVKMANCANQGRAYVTMNRDFEVLAGFLDAELHKLTPSNE
jgi:glycosyltransferase involved in cell wall biosynthesis